MGRIVELFGEVASEADVGPQGLRLPPEVYERLREEWEEEDIDDALQLVHETFMQNELVESADSLSARLVEVLGEFGTAQGWGRAESGAAVVTLDVIGQLVRRVARLEEVLDMFRDEQPPDRRGFDALRRRLMDLGIEKEMEEGRPELLLPESDEDDD